MVTLWNNVPNFCHPLKKHCPSKNYLEQIEKCAKRIYKALKTIDNLRVRNAQMQPSQNLMGLDQVQIAFTI